MSDPARRDPAPLVVFSDDWGRHPSSSQHLVSRLKGRREVLWVNTIGTRPPRLDRATARRVVEKLRHWRDPAAPLPACRLGGDTVPRVLAPRMWPSFASPAARALNRRLLGAALAPALARLPADPVVLTTIPVVADLVGVLRAHRWLYYCVDDFGAWPGYDGRTLEAMERELVPRMDAVLCAGDALAARMRALDARPGVLTHGVDLDAWRAAPGGPLPPEFEGLAPPFVVFWGLIDRRTDAGWIGALAQRMDRGSIVFIGPSDDPDPTLARLPRVALRPAVPAARLAAIAAHASVLVMPYIDAPVTRAMQPLKLKEYLATGRPAVVRALPSTEPWRDACDVRSDAQGFAQAVLARLDGRLPPAQATARERLNDEGWDRKAMRFEAWLDGEQDADLVPEAATTRCAA
jgi:hypothetical protein